MQLETAKFSWFGRVIGEVSGAFSPAGAQLCSALTCEKKEAEGITSVL